MLGLNYRIQGHLSHWITKLPIELWLVLQKVLTHEVVQNGPASVVAHIVVNICLLIGYKPTVDSGNKTVQPSDYSVFC